ncbi:MAG: alpha/beta fold hydrolase [Alphaproteobacteria bacterium]|nr:alpha/beta fold hydrolase [Alphaproteobacteria bacterium]
MNSFNYNGQAMSFTCHGNGKVAVVWAHGWGQSGAALLPLAESLAGDYTHYVVDFPGFGSSAAPSTDWAVGDYAELMAAFLGSLPQQKTIWVGHSFGCRVGIKLAATHKNLLQHLVLIAAAGVPRKRSLFTRLKGFCRARLFKLLKGLAKDEQTIEKLRQKYGSRDYLNAGILRGTFIKVVNENLAQDAQQIAVPVTLIYGENDSETPVDVGQSFARLMPNSHLHIAPALDHYSILTQGRHFVLQLVKEGAEKA